MRRATLVSLAILTSLGAFAPAARPRSVDGLKNPESVVVGSDGRIFVTLIGDRDKRGDGSIAIVDPLGKITTFARGLDDPHGIIQVGDVFYVADIRKIWKVDARGIAEVFVSAGDFPRFPGYLNDLAHDGAGNFFVTDSGDRLGRRGVVYRIDSKKRITVVLEGELMAPQIPIPDGILVDDAYHIIIGEYGFGDLFRFDFASGNAQKISGGFGGADGLARGADGRVYISDWDNGRVFEVVTELIPPGLVADGFKSVADLAVTRDGRTLLILDQKAGTLTWFPIP